MPISAACPQQLDSGSDLEMAAFVHVCMNVPEVPVHLVMLGICECQQVRVDILSLLYPFVVPVVTQYLFGSEAFYSIWRHVKVLR